MSPRRQFGLLWGSVALVLVALAPLGRHLASALPSCPLRSWLDLPCLTCGTTRAALALAALDVPAALALNPLATLGWSVLVGGGLFAGAAALLGRPLPILEPRPTSVVRWTALFVLLINWVYLIVAGAV